MVSSGRIVGDAAAVLIWIKHSTLPAAEKEGLRRFVDHFPTLTFYRDDSAWLDEVERDDDVILPQWLRRMHHTLSYVMPDHYVLARFDHSAHPSLRDEELRGHWYKLNAFGSTGHEEVAFLQRMDRVRPYPFAVDNVPGRSKLAINLADQTDRRVYEYTFEDLLSIDDDDFPPEDSVFEMFPSYADMLAHVDALKMVARDDITAAKEDCWPWTIVERETSPATR